MKTLNFAFGIIAVIIAAQGLLFFFRGSQVVLAYDGILQWMWTFKMLTYVGVISTLYFVFRIRKLLKGGDYFRQDVVRYIYKLCGVAFAAALCNSAANACMETYKEFDKKHSVGLAEVKGRLSLHLFEQIFDVNLLVYVLIISLFLLTTFFLKAIEIKAENESLI